MSALLRSGKFLRLVTGIARQNQTPTATGPTVSSPSTSKHIDSSLQQQTEGQTLFQTWCSHQLQGSLPIIASASTTHDNDDSESKRDPLLEFLVEQQKISDVKDEVRSLVTEKVSENEALSESSTSSKKILRSSLRKVEKVGFDAITEQEKESSRIAEKVVVASKQSVAPNEKVDDDNASTSDTVDVTTCKEISEISTQTEDLHLEKDASLSRENVSGDKVELSAEQEEIQTSASDVTPSMFVPMVHVIEDQVTNWYPLHVACSMFRNEGRVNDLENLLLGSVGIRPEDRKVIFFWLLQSYVDHGLVDRALTLSKRLDWEGLAADFPEFHAVMTAFMQNCAFAYRPVSIKPATPLPQSSSASTCPPTPATSSADEQLAAQTHYHRKLKKSLAKENSLEGLAAFRDLERCGKKVNVTEMSTLVELLVKDDHLQEAASVTETMLQSSTYPMPKIFRFLLNRLAGAGEVELMNSLGRFLSTSVKKEVSFDNRLCNAYLASKRGGEYLDMLEGELDAVMAGDDESKIQAAMEKFPRGGAMGLLESNPHLVDQYTGLAQKFLQLGFVAPINVLWTYHFINGRYDLAMPLWESHVKSCPQIMFQKVCQTARSTANAELAWRLVDLLHSATVTQGARGIAYSCLLDVLSQKGAFDEGCDALHSALSNGVQLSDINRTALKRLKEGYERKGEKFPFGIPKKLNSYDSVSECDSEVSGSTALACN